MHNIWKAPISGIGMDMTNVLSCIVSIAVSHLLQFCYTAKYSDANICARKRIPCTENSQKITVYSVADDIRQ